MAIFRRPIDDNERHSVEQTIHGIHSTVVDTLCDHIRVIYKTAIENIQDKEIKKTIAEECKICMIYAKRMDKKLKILQNVEDYYL